MSRSDTRSDDLRDVNAGARSSDSRGGSSRSLPSSDALKHDARQFLNTAEYEFRKVVGASRTTPTPKEPDQSPADAPARETPTRRKADAPAPEADQG